VGAQTKKRKREKEKKMPFYSAVIILSKLSAQERSARLKEKET
jgi:hypothetical protein